MASWAENEFSRSHFHDRRISKSFGKIADKLTEHFDCSFSGASGPALRQAGGRTFRSEVTTPGLVLSGHVEATVERCSGLAVVLVASDTTSFNYDGHVQTTGLGPLKNKNDGRGLHSHGALAMTEGGTPLGVLHLEMWSRRYGAAPVTQDQSRKTAVADKESRKWLAGVAAVQKALEDCLDEGSQVVVIQDREADMYDLLAMERHSNLHLLVRAAHPRTVKVGEAACTLFEACSAAAVCGTYEVEVSERDGQRRRTARMELRFLEMELQPPDKRKAQFQPIRTWVVSATETGAPSGVKPLSWTLLSTLEVSDEAAARLCVARYAKRWMIERLHYTLKSGLNAEKLMMRDVHPLKNALALYYVIAWQILWLLQTSRESPDTPAQEAFDPVERHILAQRSKKPVETVAQALRAVAELGGYHAYTKAPPPGVKSLWIGLRRLADIKIGYCDIPRADFMNQP